MPPKLTVEDLPPSESEEKLAEQAKVIRADTFDQFIEDQLQRDHFEDESEFDVVCHVY